MFASITLEIDMAKKDTVFICNECGHQQAKWSGQCSQCNQWNSFEEERKLTIKRSTDPTSHSQISEPKKIHQIENEIYDRVCTGIGEFDRVVGGGLVTGSLILIGGEPGIGKSTLLMNVCGQIAKNNSDKKLLYVSGEESVSQVASRSKRLGIGDEKQLENLYILNETSWERILTQIKKIKPTYFVLDSIQTTNSDEIQSAPGTVSQIREVTYQVMNYAKANNITCFIIGHVTKEGSIAGPKILEHMVDTVIYFEGDQYGQYRILRVMKNRFGNTNEIGIFEMSGSGLVEVANPSQYFLEGAADGSFGRSLTCVLEGSRALFVETQALVIDNRNGNGRRTTQGVDGNRVAMLVAVVEKYFDMPLSFSDVYINVVGGMKLSSRESDLSVIASILSSIRNKPIDDSIIFLGEVGLTGEIRSVPFVEDRIKEAAQLGYKKVILSAQSADSFRDKYKIQLQGITKATQLEDLLFQ